MLCTSSVGLNIRANCSSRPSGTPASPWATAFIDFGRDGGSDRPSGTTMLSRRLLATTFHVALGARSESISHCACPRIPPPSVVYQSSGWGPHSCACRA